MEKDRRGYEPTAVGHVMLVGHSEWLISARNFDWGCVGVWGYDPECDSSLKCTHAKTLEI